MTLTLSANLDLHSSDLATTYIPAEQPAALGGNRHIPAEQPAALGGKIFAISARPSPMVPQLAIKEPVARPERRRYDRMSVRCQCWLEGDDLTVYGPTADIGVGGLFLRTAVPVAQGSQVDIVLRVSTEVTPISARAVVTRIVPARAGSRSAARSSAHYHGVGVEFVEFRKGEQTLAALLRSSQPLPWL